jgi:predicted DNA-binding transcriptional regulator AlpA
MSDESFSRPTACGASPTPAPLATDRKALQRTKIREIRSALLAAGRYTLDEQAKALGLSRSTTWSIMQGNHKASGLSTSVIDRMLQSDELPPEVHLKISEYVEEKASGRYGDANLPLRKFRARLETLRRAKRLFPNRTEQYETAPLTRKKRRRSQ